MNANFSNRGFTEIIPIQFKDELKNLQSKIYGLTKNLLEEHDDKINIAEKIKLRIKKKPSNEIWSNLMEEINISEELKTLINSKSIKDTKDEINEILSKLEDKNSDLETSKKDYDRLLKLSKHMDSLFKKKLKDFTEKK